MDKKGKEYEEICKEITEYQKSTYLVFVLKSLTNLANNGRVSPAVAKIAGVLGIHVVGIASEVGTLEQKAKCRGEKKGILAVWKQMKELGYCGGKVRIHHCFNLEAAKQLKEMITSEFANADVKDVSLECDDENVYVVAAVGNGKHGIAITHYSENDNDGAKKIALNIEGFDATKLKLCLVDEKSTYAPMSTYKIENNTVTMWLERNSIVYIEG